MQNLPHTHLLVSKHGHDTGLMFVEDIAEVGVCRKIDQAESEVKILRCVCANEESRGMKTQTDGVVGYVCQDWTHLRLYMIY